MRCLSCNKRLTEYEATMKDSRGQYLDFCLSCYSTISGEVRCTGNPYAAHHYETDAGLDGLPDD